MNKNWWQQANKQPTIGGGVKYIIIKYAVTMGKMASTSIHEDYDQHPRQVHYVQSWAKGTCATKTSMEKLVEGMQDLLPSFWTRFLLFKSPSYHPLTTTYFPIQLVNNQRGKQPLTYIYI
jgi:hypothetical protein